MKYKLSVLLIIMVFLAACSKEKYILPEGMKEGVLSTSTDPIYNEKGHIPLEVLNYPGLTDEERDFFIRLSKKKKMFYCMEDDKFEESLQAIRKEPMLKDLLIGDLKVELDTVFKYEVLNNQSYKVHDAPPPSGLKSMRTETRLKYLQNVTIKGLEIGRVQSISVAAFDRSGRIFDGTVTTEFRKREGLLFGIFKYTDKNSFGNANPRNNSLFCMGRGECYFKLNLVGFENQPIVENIQRSYEEFYEIPDNGGFPPDGGGGGMGEAYLYSFDCYGPYILANDANFAFSVLNAMSFKPDGQQICIRAPYGF
jgi:hypothetical protein